MQHDPFAGAPALFRDYLLASIEFSKSLGMCTDHSRAALDNLYREHPELNPEHHKNI